MYFIIREISVICGRYNLFVDNLGECVDEFFDHERLSLDLIELEGYEVVNLHAQVGSQLTHVLFSHYHLLVLRKHGSGVGRQRVQVLEVSLCHLVTCGTKLVHGRVQMTVGRAEATMSRSASPASPSTSRSGT